MNPVHVLDIARARIIRFDPFQRNDYGRLIQRPIIEIADTYGAVYTLRGRTLMWELFDNLFPDDPLPRNPVNDDLFSPEPGTPSAEALLLDFMDEAAANGVEHVLLVHSQNNVQRVAPMNDLMALSEQTVVYDMLDKLSPNRPVVDEIVYRDRSGPHLRTQITIGTSFARLEVVDLGRRWYIRVVASEHDVLMDGPAKVARDDIKYLSTILSRLWEGQVLQYPAQDRYTWEDEAHYPVRRTIERDLLRHERWCRRIKLN